MGGRIVRLLVDRLPAAPDPQIDHPSLHPARIGPVKRSRRLQGDMDRRSAGIGHRRTDLPGRMDHAAVRRTADPLSPDCDACPDGRSLRPAQEQPSEAPQLQPDPHLRDRRQRRIAGHPTAELTRVSGGRLPDLRQNAEKPHAGRPAGLLLRDGGECPIPAEPQGYRCHSLCPHP